MKVLVLGGGPAGMTAALAAARAGAEVLLLEQNERIGKKLLLTGNGKCNYTNLELDVARYDTDGPDFVRELIKRYPPKAIIRFLEELGVPPLSRHGGWIYPHAEQAAAVLNALRAALEREQAAVRTGTRILGIQREKKGGFRIRTEEKPLYADRVILALGGSALAKTGSDGSGFRYAEELGLKLEAPRPALCPLRSTERENPFFRAAQGVRVPAELTLFVDNAARGRESGELQLTKEGFSGIAVFQLSLFAGRALAEKRKTELCINFLADFTADTDFFARRLSLPFATDLEAVGNGLVPKNLWGALLRRAALTPQQAVKRGDWELAKRLSAALTASRFTLQGLGSLEKAQVSAGGIALSELSGQSLSFRRVPGLYAAGEILNVTGPCGGYNLHWCFASGLSAGQSAASDEVRI
ncbi:NAD(P)/FAD-dependent oxidoreductase [Stomatobaculum longum]|uniref:NAD(P)/FAD-dependent oxidoreductase n=1 Tax=Stomatobaculum longum TaxID=796942 RepID=UPI0028ECFFDF|nr:aminoacetone oxidase family FAD-binding enzyme [Stomatobaculum longum]